MGLQFFADKDMVTVALCVCLCCRMREALIFLAHAYETNDTLLKNGETRGVDKTLIAIYRRKCLTVSTAALAVSVCDYSKKHLQHENVTFMVVCSCKLKCWPAAQEDVSGVIRIIAVILWELSVSMGHFMTFGQKLLWNKVLERQKDIQANSAIFRLCH